LVGPDIAKKWQDVNAIKEGVRIGGGDNKKDRETSMVREENVAGYKKEGARAMRKEDASANALLLVQ